MGVMQKLSESIKRGLRSWLNVMPANPYNIQINEVADFETNAIRNRIWYRGDSNELEQLYQKIGKKLKEELCINHITLQAECERGRNDKMIVSGRGNNEN